MGKGVLAVDTSASPYLRSYAHCSKGRVSLYYNFLPNYLEGINFGAM
jgi:hypothetical protein